MEDIFWATFALIGIIGCYILETWLDSGDEEHGSSF